MSPFTAGPHLHSRPNFSAPSSKYTVSRKRCHYIFASNFAKYRPIFGQAFVKRFALCYRAVVPSLCLFVLSVTLVYCGQTVGQIKMKLGTQVDLGPGHIVLDGDPALPSPKVHSPQLLAHICCGQMAGCMKMSLGRKVGFNPSDIVLDGDPTPLPKKGQSPPIFGPCLLQSNGCMDQDATWYGGLEVGLGPGHILDGDPAPLPSKMGQSSQFLAYVCCGQTAGWIQIRDVKRISINRLTE